MAYLNLVSSIETLCIEHPIEEVTLSDFNLELSSLIDLIENKELKEKIEKVILKKERFISRRFVSFILDHIEESFWVKNEETPGYGQIKPEQLPELLKRIYMQRSRTLHAGEPFPPSIFMSPGTGADIDFSLGMSVGEKKWEPKDFIPYAHFFEKLVNHVLNVFLERNQREREARPEKSAKVAKA